MTDDEIPAGGAAAIQALLSSIDPGALLSRFVLVAEVLDSDGDRASWVLSPDTTPWDVMGLLSYGLELWRAKVREAED